MNATDRVYECIKAHLDTSGYCQLTGKEIAEKVDTSARTVETAIKTLTKEKRIFSRLKYGRRFLSLEANPKVDRTDLAKRLLSLIAKEGKDGGRDFFWAQKTIADHLKTNAKAVSQAYELAMTKGWVGYKLKTFETKKGNKYQQDRRCYYVTTKGYEQALDLPPPPAILKQENIIKSLQADVLEKGKQLAEKDKQLAEKDKQLAEKDRLIAEMTKEHADLRAATATVRSEPPAQRTMFGKASYEPSEDDLEAALDEYDSSFADENMFAPAVQEVAGTVEAPAEEPVEQSSGSRLTVTLNDVTSSFVKRMASRGEEPKQEVGRDDDCDYDDDPDAHWNR